MNPRCCMASSAEQVTTECSTDANRPWLNFFMSWVNSAMSFTSYLWSKYPSFIVSCTILFIFENRKQATAQSWLAYYLLYLLCWPLLFKLWRSARLIMTWLTQPTKTSWWAPKCPIKLIESCPNWQGAMLTWSWLGFEDWKIKHPWKRVSDNHNSFRIPLLECWMTWHAAVVLHDLCASNL